MLWWAETNVVGKTRLIAITLNLARPFISHVGDLLFAQPFSRQMVVSPLGITFVLFLICT